MFWSQWWRNIPLCLVAGSGAASTSQPELAHLDVDGAARSQSWHIWMQMGQRAPCSQSWHIWTRMVLLTPPPPACDTEKMHFPEPRAPPCRASDAHSCGDGTSGSHTVPMKERPQCCTFMAFYFRPPLQNPVSCNKTWRGQLLCVSTFGQPPCSWDLCSFRAEQELAAHLQSRALALLGLVGNGLDEKPPEKAQAVVAEEEEGKWCFSYQTICCVEHALLHRSPQSPAQSLLRQPEQDTAALVSCSSAEVAAPESCRELLCSESL